MSRPTVAQLLERIEALEVEVAALRGQQVQLVREVLPPKPISEPLDFQQLAINYGEAFAAYSEAGDVWGASTYL